MMSEYFNLAKQLENLGKKWSFFILMSLFSNETLGFNDIKNMVTPISSRTLAIRLKDLEKFGLITRGVLLEFPKKVEYKLTESGKKFIDFSINFFDVRQ